MAEETEQQVADAVTGGKDVKSSASAGGKSPLVLILVSLGVSALFGTVGFVLAKVMSHSPSAASAAQTAAAEPAEPEEKAKGGVEEVAYLDFEPITVNLNEPRLARYIRAGVTLTVPKAKEAAAKKALEASMPKLKNWLTIHLAGQTLEDVRGTKNMNRLAREIQDAFNEQLWPNQKPLIEDVLFKEFGVQ